ncbi:MAG: SIMPL domain-containing protein [Candidatus Levybacteria bacterium]|nr:SIMPL domain-containing protein [Candidatus Levybacteria bacterium]
MKGVFVYALIVLITLFALIFIKEFDISYPLAITTAQKSSELAVVGEGKVTVIPDSGSVEAGITVSNASTTGEVSKTISQTNNKIVEAMKNLGIKKEDIKTTNYSITPNYSYENGKNTITGYNGNATVSIKVKNTQLISRVIDEATAVGANQVIQSGFSVENMEKYREEARNLAIENAKTQAQKLAKTLGINLGRISNIVESTPQSPIMFRSSAPGIGRDTAEIEPGIQTVTSTITLYFEKK